MHDSIEAFLEIDALGKAVGRDEDTLVVLSQQINPSPPFVRRKLTGDAHHLPTLEPLTQRPRHGLRGCDVAAEDHRAESLVQQGLKVLYQRLQLGVALRFRRQRGGGLDQLLQSRIANVGGGLDVIVRTIICLAIEHSLGNRLGLVFRAHRAGRAF